MRVFLERLEQRAQVVSEIVEPDPEITLRVRPEHFVKLANLAGLGIGLEELVPENGAQFRRGLLQRNRLLQHLEHARLVAHREPALLLGGLEELGQFAQRPLGLQVARRDDGDEDGDAAQPVQQRFSEQVVARELRVAPDVRRLAEQLRHAHFKGAMKVGDPALAALDQFQVVEMCVTDEGVALEIHVRGSLYVCAAAVCVARQFAESARLENRKPFALDAPARLTRAS